MFWHYRIRRRCFKGEPYFDVVEFFRDGKSRAWTKRSMYPTGSTRQEVIRALEMMLKDCKKTKAFTDTENDVQERMDS